MAAKQTCGTSVVVKVRDVGDAKSGPGIGATLVARETVWVPGASFAWMVRAPVSDVAPIEFAVTETVHDAEGASVLLQVLVCPKLESDTVMLWSVSGAVPELVSVTACGTPAVVKTKDIGDTTSGPGTVAMFVLSGTVCIPVVSLVTIESVAVSGVAQSVFATVAVTETVQLA